MNEYHVYGTISGETYNSWTRANNGAEAIRTAVSMFMDGKGIHFHGKQWRQRRDAWIRENVRLSAKQVA